MHGGPKLSETWSLDIIIINLYQFIQKHLDPCPSIPIAQLRLLTARIDGSGLQVGPCLALLRDVAGCCGHEWAGDIPFMCLVMFGKYLHSPALPLSVLLSFEALKP